MKRRIYPWMLVFFLLFFLCPIRAQAAQPEMENTVWCDPGGWRAFRSAMPWETVLCRGAAELPGDGQQILRCHLTPGLEYVTVTSVKCNGEAVNASLYTIVTALLDDESAFALHLSAGAGKRGDLLEIEYTLRLNDKAVAGGEGNWFWLSLSDENGLVRMGEEGKILTWTTEVYRGIRIPEAPGQSNPISGACLCLYTDPELSHRVAFTVRNHDLYLTCADAGCSHSRHTYVMRTPENGKFRLEGLRAGTYYLQETRPPDGLTAAAEVQEITVTEEGTVFSSGILCENGAVSVLYTPSAAEKIAGHRTLLDYYKAGSRILAAALAFLVATRRYYLY